MPVADTHKEIVGTPLPFPLHKMPEQKILAWQWNLDFTFLESIIFLDSAGSTSLEYVFALYTKFLNYTFKMGTNWLAAVI